MSTIDVNANLNLHTDDYEINMWICLDKNVFIHVSPHNCDEIIKYLYERFPY